MARLFQYESLVQMLPYEHTDKSNPIVSLKDIPTEVDDFQIFVPFAHVNNKSRVLKMNFRISCEIPLWTLKMVPLIKNFLQQRQI